LSWCAFEVKDQEVLLRQQACLKETNFDALLMVDLFRSGRPLKARVGLRKGGGGGGVAFGTPLQSTQNPKKKMGKKERGASFLYRNLLGLVPGGGDCCAAEHLGRGEGGLLGQGSHIK